MASEFASMLTSAKAAIDIVKYISTLKTDFTVKEKTIELYDIILRLYDSISFHYTEYNKIVQLNVELEEEIMNIKQWDRQRKKYMLKEIDTGVFVYVHKNPKSSVSDKHWVCANCFDNEQKESVLQNKKRGNIPNHIYYCPQCKNEISIKNLDYSQPKPQVLQRRTFRGDGNSWN